MAPARVMTITTTLMANRMKAQYCIGMKNSVF